ncbi:MAG: Mut7-C ubiquitin/RNAse domain-containing protein [Lysobacter sp.]|nr:Mut7-C ubiquitin/RNAse domain-containing protein [Lysobacter sp.]
MPAQRQCEFRFYEELNDFLAPPLRRRSFPHAFDDTPAVKDRIESLGVPHTEVDLILVDGEPAPFTRRLHGGERVAVYPMFECFDVSDVGRLRPRPLREPRFVLDVHLGRLANYLRLLGFDCLYRNDFSDADVIRIARDEHRIVLSRDIGLLKRAELTHGAFVHATDPRRQLREVIDRFQLESRIAPFTRCARCNAEVERIPAGEAVEAPPAVARNQVDFSRCTGCRRLYWRGSHPSRLQERLAEVGIDLGAAP